VIFALYAYLKLFIYKVALCLDCVFFFKATFQITDLIHLCTMVPEIAAQIVALNNDGRSVRYIAQHLNMPRSTEQDALLRFRETHGFTRRPDLIIAGQQLIEMTVFCVFLYCEIGDCHQLSLLDD
jgi:hypothetical protein